MTDQIDPTIAKAMTAKREHDAQVGAYLAALVATGVRLDQISVGPTRLVLDPAAGPYVFRMVTDVRVLPTGLAMPGLAELPGLAPVVKFAGSTTIGQVEDVPPLRGASPALLASIAATVAAELDEAAADIRLPPEVLRLKAEIAAGHLIDQGADMSGRTQADLVAYYEAHLGPNPQPMPRRMRGTAEAIRHEIQVATMAVLREAGATAPWDVVRGEIVHQVAHAVDEAKPLGVRLEGVRAGRDAAGVVTVCARLFGGGEPVEVEAVVDPRPDRRGGG
jgi:hypothetical protein